MVGGRVVCFWLGHVTGDRSGAPEGRGISRPVLVTLPAEPATDLGPFRYPRLCPVADYRRGNPHDRAQGGYRRLSARHPRSEAVAGDPPAEAPCSGGIRPQERLSARGPDGPHDPRQRGLRFRFRKVVNVLRMAPFLQYAPLILLPRRGRARPATGGDGHPAERGRGIAARGGGV